MAIFPNDFIGLKEVWRRGYTHGGPAAGTLGRVRAAVRARGGGVKHSVVVGPTSRA
jgi:hypothetical protein